MNEEISELINKLENLIYEGVFDPESIFLINNNFALIIHGRGYHFEHGPDKNSLDDWSSKGNVIELEELLKNIESETVKLKLEEYILKQI